MNHTTKKSLLLLLIAAFTAFPAVAAEPFQQPAVLEPDVNFWRQVFAEINSNQALLHDSRYLEVVYEVVNMPEDASSSRRRRIADLTRERYRNVLEKLASGKRSDLNGEEKRVLALWPEDITNKELREAAKRIRFQQGLSDRFVEGLERSGAWRAYIEEHLISNDVPVGLSALPHVESSFNPEARSHVGAAGLWQFTRPTGQRFMVIDHVVDERRDPFFSSAAAAELLAYNYSILKSWPLAITAYNHGVAGMRRAVQTMKTEDIGVINREYTGRTFGFASRNFYVAFLAALEVDQNYEQYFGSVVKSEPSVDLILTTRHYMPVAAMAAAMGVSEQTLKRYNPALLAPVWDGSKYIPSNFQPRIPQSLVDSTAGEVMEAIPVGMRFAAQTPDQYHKISRGESLSVIATRYGTTVSQLVALNDLKSQHKIRTGQTLRLPYAGAEIAIPGGAETYQVRNGDSLSVIAARAGVSESSLMALNNLSDKNRIYVGQVISLRSTQTEASEPEAEDIAVSADTAAPAAVVAASEAPERVPEISESEPASFEASLADPNDYGVAPDGSIEILATETLGHYANWLDVRATTLRQLNGMASGKPVVVGKRMELDFSNVDRDAFTAKRIAHHRALQEAFFTNYRVTSTTEHKVQPGESLWLLTLNRYKVPVWLLQQYNPDLEFGHVQPGMKIVFPKIERVGQEARIRRSVAEVS